MEPNPHGATNDAVSPSVNTPNVLSAREVFRNWILGDYKGKFPSVNWNTDGNIFAVIGTIGRAWKHTDRKVYERLQTLTTFAMAGQLPSVVPNADTLSRKLREELKDYDDLLSFIIGLSEADYIEDEDEDESDEDDE